MKFNNTIAFCKGWYEPRGDADTMWMDMSHCIQVDGWEFCTNKKSVAAWCKARMCDILQEFPSTAHALSFYRFYSEMQKNRDLWKMSQKYHKERPEIDDNDLIIWTFRDFIRFETTKKMYTEGVQPSEEVLPLSETSKENWSIVENFKPQVFDKWAPDYETREAKIKQP